MGTVDAFFSVTINMPIISIPPAAFLAKAERVDRAGATRIGGNAEGLVPWEPASYREPAECIANHGDPSRHGPAGIEPFSGDVVGSSCPRKQSLQTLYVTGDTVCSTVLRKSSAGFSPVSCSCLRAQPKRGEIQSHHECQRCDRDGQCIYRRANRAVHNDSWAHFTETRTTWRGHSMRLATVSASGGSNRRSRRI